MDEKRKVIRAAIKDYLLKFKDSVHCLVDIHIAQINGNLNFNNEIKVSPIEIAEEISLLAEEGFFEKDYTENFKYYVKGDINKII